jgi:hypothetical protein
MSCSTVLNRKIPLLALMQGEEFRLPLNHSQIRRPYVQWLACAIFIILMSVPSFAQQRPLITEDPRPVADGAFVLESGFGYAGNVQLPLSGLRGDEYSVLVSGFNFSLGPRAEFQINGVVQNFVKTGHEWLNDVGDWSLSTKIRILSETHARPVISFRPTMVLPNTNDARGIGTNSTQLFGSLLLGKRVSDGFVFGNIGVGILTDTIQPRAQQDVLTYGVAGVLPITSRVNLLSEWNGWKNPRNNPSPGTESRSQVRLGVQFIAAGIRWDAAGTAGLTHLDHRAGVVFGLTKEFRLWK